MFEKKLKLCLSIYLQYANKKSKSICLLLYINVDS